MRVWLVISALFFSLTSIGQDLHFSQYYSSPLQISPSHTGFFDGKYRIGANYKYQWPFAADGYFSTFNTIAAYADFAILDNKINNTDWMGIGLIMSRDAAGDGRLSTTKIGLTSAYHKGLDRLNRTILSVGFGLNYVHRAINFDRLYFNNQWNDRDFDLSIDNLEPFNNEAHGYLDFYAGLNIRFNPVEAWRFSIGTSMHHINKPRDSFLGTNNRIGFRYIVNAYADVSLGDRMELSNSMYYTFQRGAQEGMFGSLLRIAFKSNSSSAAFVGLHYRVKDALAPVVGIETGGLRLLVNYDVNLSKLSAASNGNGGLELSLVKVGSWQGKNEFARKLYCPRF